jgi:peptidoglycan-binding protein ArfA
MSGSEEDRAVTGWRTESRLYRRKPGAGWLLALLAIPLLLAVIGWGWLNGTNNSGMLTLPTVSPSASLAVPTAPSVSTGAAAPSVGFPGMSIVRTGNDLTLTGELPDADTKKSLLESLKLVFPGANLIDKLTVTQGVKAPDMAGLGGLFSAVVNIPDFNLDLDGDTLTLTGTAPSETVKASAESYAKSAWPNVKIVNNIEVKAASPSAPAPPAPPAPGPCASLQGDVSALLKTPINYDTDGFTLAASSQDLVRQIADKLKTCSGAQVAVVGFTDNTGNDAINQPLSENRAKAVADALVSDGIAADHVSSRGAGSANPIASNDTVQGRAQNRRVEITVN